MSALTVVLRGLEVFGRHGVLEAERRLGQRFVVDLEVRLASEAAAASDRLEETVDYAALADRVAALVAGEPVALLEHLAGRIADLVLSDPLAASVRVTVHKPHVALAHAVGESAVVLERP